MPFPRPPGHGICFTGSPLLAFGLLSLPRTMTPIYALCVVFGGQVSTLTSIAESADPPKMVTERTWTSASGLKTARATLLRVDGEKLWLRRQDGSTATAALSKLSRPDRDYVASVRTRLSPDDQTAKSPSPTADVVGSVVEKAASLAKLPTWLPQGQLPIPQPVTPAALIYARVSRRFLEDYVDRNLTQRKSVNDCILGTRIFGHSLTRGSTHLRLKPSQHRALGEIIFAGTVHADTVGYNGPAILHYSSDSTFESSKTVVMGPSGITVTDADSRAPTNLQITGIDSTLPRLRGRIVRRIAGRRASRSNGEAEAITADHTAARISRDFDARTNASVARVEQVLMSKIPALSFDRSRGEATMRFRSTKDYVEMALVRANATPEERNFRPPAIDDAPDFAVRVHRTLFGTALADPEFSQTLTPLFGRLLKARIAETAATAAGGKNAGGDDSTNWSINLDWLSFDYKEPE
jgi:hypothetical protein